MTCIIGVERDGIACICGDSLALSGWTKTEDNDKVFNVDINGVTIHIGFSTSFRMGQILQYHLPNCLMLLNKPVPTVKYMVSEFVPTVQELFKARGFGKRDGLEHEGGQFLVAIGGKLFSVESNYYVHVSPSGVYTLGSGREYAMGAVTALLDSGMKVEEAIVGAMAITAKHCASVSLPCKTVISRAVDHNP